MGKKYFWLKLKENFFQQKEIKKLRKIAGGDTYTIIYLKMQLLSLKNGGLLKYEGTEENLAEQLSYEIDEEKENIQVTINFLMKNNLIEEIDRELYLLPKASECIGKEGESAERVRKYREKKKIDGQGALQSNNDVTKSNTEIEKEKELDIEKEKELQLDNKKSSSCSSKFSNLEIFKHFEKCGFIVTAMLMDQIAADIEVFSGQWLMDAATEAMNRGKINNYKYVLGILQNWQTKGRNDSNVTGGNSTKDNKSGEIKYDWSKYSTGSEEWDGQDIDVGDL